MDKQLTLEETWKLCLDMWKWIAKCLKKHKKADYHLMVDTLKQKWLDKNGYEDIDIDSNCFFCEYQAQHPGKNVCATCPGRLVSSTFDCFDDSCHFEYEPILFYKKLVRLYTQRQISLLYRRLKKYKL